MGITTLAVKVSEGFARRYREFCDQHALQVGKYTEMALTELMEDFHFGMKAQRVLSRSQGLGRWNRPPPESSGGQYLGLSLHSPAASGGEPPRQPPF